MTDEQELEFQREETLRAVHRTALAYGQVRDERRYTTDDYREAFAAKRAFDEALTAYLEAVLRSLSVHPLVRQAYLTAQLDVA